MLAPMTTSVSISALAGGVTSGGITVPLLSPNCSCRVLLRLPAPDKGVGSVYLPLQLLKISQPVMLPAKRKVVSMAFDSMWTYRQNRLDANFLDQNTSFKFT
jgi:hypothetical protein